MAGITHIDCEEKKAIFAEFYQTWHHDALVIDKWFTLQAISTLPNTLDVVKTLTQHAAYKFTNPNKVRALLGAFAMHNQINFHQCDGQAYTFMAEEMIRLDQYNPQVAARNIEPLTRWQGLDSVRQDLMRKELSRIMSTQGISRDLYEVVSKALQE
jgi:aminopeptidase N